MAIVWQHQAWDHTHKITRAGQCVRLYRNGVLHSQWNPNALLSGHLWELFILTSMTTQMPLQRICVLGTGGGSVIMLLQHFFPDVHIDAVELDEIHLFTAKKFFQINNCQHKTNLFSVINLNRDSITVAVIESLCWLAMTQVL